MNEELSKGKLEYLKVMNDRVYEQLSYAETKNGILLGLLTAIIGVVVGALIGNASIPNGLKIYLMILSISFSISLILCLLSFFPNLKVLINSPNPNLYFYGSLAKFQTISDYDDCIEKNQSIIVHLEAQNIFVSKIILTKHKLFIIAIHFVFIGLAFPIYVGAILWRFFIKCKNAKIQTISSENFKNGINK